MTHVRPPCCSGRAWALFWDQLICAFTTHTGICFRDKKPMATHRETSGAILIDPSVGSYFSSATTIPRFHTLA